MQHCSGRWASGHPVLVALQWAVGVWPPGAGCTAVGGGRLATRCWLHCLGGGQLQRGQDGELFAFSLYHSSLSRVTSRHDAHTCAHAIDLAFTWPVPVSVCWCFHKSTVMCLPLLSLQVCVVRLQWTCHSIPALHQVRVSGEPYLVMRQLCWTRPSSDTGTTRPESCLFTLVLALGAALGGAHTQPHCCMH